MEGPAVRSPRMGGVLDGFWPTPYPGCPAGMRAHPHTAPSLKYPCLYTRTSSCRLPETSESSPKPEGVMTNSKSGSYSTRTYERK